MPAICIPSDSKQVITFTIGHAPYRQLTNRSWSYSGHAHRVLTKCSSPKMLKIKKNSTFQFLK